MSEPEKPARTTADVLRRSLRRLVIATIVLYLLLGGVVWYVYGVARDNTDGLCAFRNDVAGRVEGSKQFLIDHPDGSGDITPELLKATITQGQQTVKALSSVNCPAPPNLALTTPTPTP